MQSAVSIRPLTKILAIITLSLVCYAAQQEGGNSREGTALALKAEDSDTRQTADTEKLRELLRQRHFDAVLEQIAAIGAPSQELQEIQAEAIGGKARIEHHRRVREAKAEATKLLQENRIEQAWQLARQFDEPEFSFVREDARDRFAAQAEPELLKAFEALSPNDVFSKLHLAQELVELRPKSETYRGFVRELEERRSSLSALYQEAPESRLQEAQKMILEFEKRLLALDGSLKAPRNEAEQRWKKLAGGLQPAAEDADFFKEQAAAFRGAMQRTAGLFVQEASSLPLDVRDALDRVKGRLTDSYNCMSLALDAAMRSAASAVSQQEAARADYLRWTAKANEATAEAAQALVQAKLKVGIAFGKQQAVRSETVPTRAALTRNSSPEAASSRG